MWVATARYDLGEAPGGLAFVQDFLNSGPSGRPAEEDLFADRASAQRWVDGAVGAWSKRRPHPVPSPTLSVADVKTLRELRVSLEDALRGIHPDVAQWKVALTASISADGTAAINPSGTGWRVVAGILLIEMLAAQQTDEWRRLKVCRNEGCTCTFFDRSKNNSAVWSNTAMCGNAPNLRASRARRAATAASKK